MITTLVLTGLAILVLLFLSGTFSGSETALTACSRARMHQLEKAGDTRAGIVNRLLDARERMIGGILLGNNLVNILASALATNLFIQHFGDAGVLLTTALMTALVVVFAEVLPKTYAILNPDRSALIAAPYLRPVIAALGPVAAGIEAVVKGVFIMFRVNSSNEDMLVSPHEEIRGQIDLHHKEGGFIKDDRDMLGGLLDLQELEVSDIMIHRTNMETLNADDSPTELVRQVVDSVYTRLPLWRNEPENIVGVLHAKDLVRALQKAVGRVDGLDIPAIAKKPWFVPDTTTVQDQLNNFLKRKSHFALVVDEYGEVQGLVTLEDILEEIVGEISDEHDVAITGLKMLSGGAITVDGTVPIRDVNRAMDWHLPDDEATTIAGLVIHEAQQIPDKGQVFVFHGFRFAVEGRKRNRITSLRITPLERHRERLEAPSEVSG